MAGQLIQRSPGSWTIILFLGRDARTGKKLYKQHTVRGSKRDAERERVRLAHSLNSGGYQATTRQTVGEYLLRWLAEYARRHVAGSTYTRYESIVREHLLPALGHIRLSRLSPQDVKTYYAQACDSGRHDGKGGLSPTTVLQHHRILREALRHAVNEGVLVANPADRVAAPRRVRREMPTLDEDQTGELLSLTKGTNLFIPVVLAVATGLRRGEILALQWRDTDLARGTITVQRSVEVTADGLDFKQPKTQRGRRRIPLPRFAVDALREHKRLQSAQRLQLGPGYENQDLVCPLADGKTWDPNGFSAAFAKVVKRSKLPKIRFHDLRHSHATLLLRHGTNPKIVSERLGHSSIALTLDTYSHVLPDMQEAAAETIERALGQLGSGNAGD